MPHFEFGPSLLEHLLLKSGFTQNTKVKDFPREAAERLSMLYQNLASFMPLPAVLSGSKPRPPPSPFESPKMFISFCSR